jgi:hypothetical protein
MVLGPGLAIFFASAKALELAGHYQPQTYCLRSGGFVPWSLCHSELRNSRLSAERRVFPGVEVRKTRYEKSVLPSSIAA